jgi:hypothetical protein
MDGRKGKSEDEWEVLEDSSGIKGAEVQGDQPRVKASPGMGDSVMREEDEQGWDEARREA